MAEVEKAHAKPRRSRTQSARDDRALTEIVTIVCDVTVADSAKVLREWIYRIVDVLVEAGRL